jgi:hypothetical protein
MDIPYTYPSKYGIYKENYRHCKRCGTWEIIIAQRWFVCNPPRLTDEEKIKLGF